MLGIPTLQVVLVVYAVLLIIGGLIGFLKARSRPSLIAGAASGAIALAAAYQMGSDPRASWQGIILAAAMLVVFAIRFGKTRKFMPSGMLGILSLVVMAVLLVGRRD